MELPSLEVFKSELNKTLIKYTAFKVIFERCVGFDNLLRSQNKFSYHLYDSLEIRKNNNNQTN